MTSRLIAVHRPNLAPRDIEWKQSHKLSYTSGCKNEADLMSSSENDYKQPKQFAAHCMVWIEWGVNNWPAIQHGSTISSRWLSWKLKGCRRHGTSMKALGTQPWRHVTMSYHVTNKNFKCVSNGKHHCYKKLDGSNIYCYCILLSFVLRESSQHSCPNKRRPTKWAMLVVGCSQLLQPLHQQNSHQKLPPKKL